MKKIIAFLLLFCFLLVNAKTNEVYAQSEVEYRGEIVNKNDNFLVNNNADLTLGIESSIYNDFTKEKDVNAERDIHIDVFVNDKLYQSDILNTTNNSQSYKVETNKLKSNDKVRVKITLYKNNKKLHQKKLSFSILNKDKYSKIYLASPASYEWSLKNKEDVNILMQVYSISNEGKKIKFTKPLSLSSGASDNKTYPVRKIKSNKYKIYLSRTFIPDDVTSIAFNPTLMNSNIPLVAKTTQLHIERNVPIAELSFSSDAYTLDKKETFKLVPTYKPLDSDEIHNLSWSSSDTNIVRVAEDGTLTAINKGDAIIRVSGKKVRKDIAVKVIQSLKTIKTSDKEYSIDVDDVFEIPYKLNPVDTDVAKNDITLTSDNPSIIEVLDSTRIRAINPGKTTITLQYEDIRTKVVIYVQPKIEKIEANKDKYYLSPGEEIPLSYSVTPSLASFSKKPKIVIESSNPEIVEVTSDGKLKGISQGMATVNIKYKDILQQVQIEVSIPKEELPLKEKLIEISQDIDLKSVVDIPIEEIISIKSNDENIVTIDNNIIKALQNGETFLTIETKDKIGILTVNVNLNIKEREQAKPENSSTPYLTNYAYVCFPKNHKSEFKNLLLIK